jgi:hypothetical protein
MRMVSLIGLALCAMACSKSGNVTKPVTTDTTTVKDTTTAKDTTGTKPVVSFVMPTYNPATLDSSLLFHSVPVVHDLARTDLQEISGVAASRTHPGILYIHNDSGNPADVYLTDSTGADRGTLSLPVVNRDWEDIAVGPGPVPGISYVYVADIGDNNAVYPQVYIYRFPEPALGATIIDSVTTITLKYPDGPRNAETLMVDPQGNIYIVSKESGLAKIYMAKFPQDSVVMKPLVQLVFNKATGGDISADGKEIILRNKEMIWYWSVKNGSGIIQTLQEAPQLAPYANNEPQGEGVGFSATQNGYYTDTEIKGYGVKATLSFYSRK